MSGKTALVHLSLRKKYEKSQHFLQNPTISLLWIYPGILHRQTLTSSCTWKHLYTHWHVHTRKHKQTEAALTRCLSASWTASCCTCGPGLVFCLFVGEVVCVVVKVKGKHSSSSSDVWTCWECPPEPAKQLDPLPVAGWRRVQLHSSQADRAW